MSNKVLTLNGNVLVNNGNAVIYDDSGGSTPNLQSKTNINPTTSSQTITYDSGYDGLSSVQINAMPTGTAGTPVATKGTVSNNSITVTPSVTNTTGYITGGTKTGTAVSVSASELVSGTKSIFSNGTGIDVTNYASVDVSVSGGSSANIEDSKSYTVSSSGSATISPSSGYDAMAEVALTVPSGTYSLSATKGAVFNNSITVTPEVTITGGYISSQSLEGNSVTVSASELVSGNLEILDSGTQDVTNFKNVIISAGSATTPATTITANPNIYVNTSTGVITATTSASQSITPTISTGFVSTGTSGTVTVSGSNTSSLSTQTATTITPTESSQTAVAAGKYTLGAVTVGAISSTYVGSGIDRNDATDLTASGDTVQVPQGYYANSVSKAVASGSASPVSSLSSTGATITTGENRLILSKTVSNTPQVSAGYVSSGTSGNTTVTLTATASIKAAMTYTPTTTNQTISSGTYLTGTQTIAGDANLVAENIKNGVSIFGVNGTSSSWTLLGYKDFTVSTTSTSATSAGTIDCGSSAFTDNKIIYVKVRDKAGARSGYFVGSDAFFFNFQDANSSTSTLNYATRAAHRCNSDGTYNTYPIGTSTGYGVYGYSITSAGVVNIYRRYNSTYSLTVNGTYRVEVYALDYAPNQGNPFNYSYSS